MSKPKFKQLNAMIWVTDVSKAIDFYTRKMGFELTFKLDEDGPCSFAIVERDGIEFHLEVCACKDGRHTGNAFVEVLVEDVEQLYQDLKTSGVEIVRELCEQDWGQTDFKAADPDGNWVLFSSDFDDDHDE